MRTRIRGWRWRRSPLRRRCDVAEAWTVLAVVVLLWVGAPAAGAAVGWQVHEGARARAAAQRAERHQVQAVLVDAAPAAVASPTGRKPLYAVRVRWTEPGREARTGVARVPAGARRGDRTPVWLDSRGRDVGPPVNDATLWQHTLMAGLFTVWGVVAVVLGGHFAARRIAARRRLAEWEREWALTGPKWRRHTA